MVNPRTKTKRRTAASQQVNLRNARSTNWITAGVIALFALASIVSFSGLYEISSWQKLPQWAYFAIPGFVDGAIVVYKFAEIKLRQDPTRAHLAYKAKLGVLAFTALSSAGNTVHVISLQDPDPVRYWGAIAFAASAPWAIYLAATVLTDLVVKPKARRVKPAAKPAPAPATVKARPARQPTMKARKTGMVVHESFEEMADEPDAPPPGVQLALKPAAEAPPAFAAASIPSFTVDRTVQPMPDDWK